MFYEQDIGPELLGRENSEFIIQQYRGNTPLSYPALILLFSPAKKPAHSYRFIMTQGCTLPISF